MAAGRIQQLGCGSSFMKENCVSEPSRANSAKPPEEVTRHLRSLAHDLSNSLETILQASYLLGQVKLDENSRKWVKFIDTAANDAAQLNRQIREILKSQG
jgi:signal transduction histidine kinase